MPLLQFEVASSNMMPVQRAWWQGKQEATFSKQMKGRAPRNSICSGSRHSGHTASHSYCSVTSVNPRSDRHRILRPCYLSNIHTVQGSISRTKYKFKGHPRHLTTQIASGKRPFDSVAYIYKLNNEVRYLRDTQCTFRVTLWRVRVTILAVEKLKC